MFLCDVEPRREVLNNIKFLIPPNMFLILLFCSGRQMGQNLQAELESPQDVVSNLIPPVQLTNRGTHRDLGLNKLVESETSAYGCGRHSRLTWRLRIIEQRLPECSPLVTKQPGQSDASVRRTKTSGAQILARTGETAGLPSYPDLFNQLVPARNTNTIYTTMLLKPLMSIRILLKCNSDAGIRDKA